MKNICRIVVVCLVFCMLGCAGTDVTPRVGCENSLILKQIPDVKGVDFLLRLANVEALRHGLYTKSEALEVIAKLEELTNSKYVTYADLAAEVIKYVDWVNEHAGVEVFMIMDYLNGFKDVAVTINDCDRDLFIDHLERQKFYVNMVR